MPLTSLRVKFVYTKHSIKKINPTLAYSYLLSSDFPYNLAAAFKNILSMEQANVCRCVGKSEGYCTSKHLYATF